MTHPTIQPRIDYTKASPAAIQAMRQLEATVRAGGLDPTLLELVKTRASQLNSCAYCIDMHTKDALALGETEQRLFALSAWRETPFFTDKERAALAWTEALTNIQQGHAPDDIYSIVATHFDDSELMMLSLAITTINAWNRLAIGFRAVPGTYQPPTASHS